MKEKIILILNEIFYKILHGHFIYKAILNIIMLIIFFIIFQISIVDSAKKINDNLVKKVEAKKNTIISLIKKEKNLETIRSQILKIENKEKKIKLIIPERISVPAFLSELSETLKSSQLNILSLYPAGVEKRKDINLYAIKFNATLQGTYNKLIKLIVGLTDRQLQELIVLRDLEVGKINNSNQLKIKISLETYSINGD